MGICLRYSQSREQAEEILNDGFLKVFSYLSKHQEVHSFKAWLRKVLVNAAIDHHRSNQKHYYSNDIENIYDHNIHIQDPDQLSEQDLITFIQLLPPAYQMVFNLYAIEGYKHREIAQKLGITEGTSKSNLAKARTHLKRMLSIGGYGEEDEHE